MANGLFYAYKAVVMGDNTVTGFSVPDLEGGDQRIVLFDTADDTLALATDQDLADLAAGARVATVALTAEAVANPSAAVANYDSADPTFSAVTGDQSEQIVLYEHTGTEATSLFIALYDTFASGMPVTPNGGDILVTVNASGWWSW